MVFWIFMTLLLAAVGAAAVYGSRLYHAGDLARVFPTWFATKAEPRLGVSEQMMVDGRRKLVLIRRDDIEHLVLTGGPVDVVIETGIKPPRETFAHHESAYDAITEPPAQPVFTRPPRTFGQAVNE